MSKYIPPILSLILLFLSLARVTADLSSVLSYTLEPITAPLISIRLGLKQSLATIRSIPTLSKQLKALEQENQELIIKTQGIATLQRDLAVFRGNANKNFRLAPVRIISINHQAIVTSADIDLIKPGQALVSGSTLIGIVTEVHPRTVTIDLLTETTNSVHVTLGDRIQGKFTTKDFVPLLFDVDNSIPLSLSESVFTRGDENMPNNLLIGTIKKITSKPSDPSQTATLNLSGTFSDDHLAIIVDF